LLGRSEQRSARHSIGLPLGVANDDETEIVVIGYEVNEFRGQLAARERRRWISVGSIVPAGCDSQHQIAGVGRRWVVEREIKFNRRLTWVNGLAGA